MSTLQPSSRERLHDLLGKFISGHIDTEFFCEEFERVFNLETDKRDLSEVERAAFSALFDKVVWYSPFPDERAKIPNYLGESDIRRAAEEAARVLHSVSPAHGR